MKCICYLVPYRLLLASCGGWIVQMHSKNVGGETRIIHNDFWDVLCFEIFILCELSTASLQSSTGYSAMRRLYYKGLQLHILQRSVN